MLIKDTQDVETQTEGGDLLSDLVQENEKRFQELGKTTVLEIYDQIVRYELLSFVIPY